MVLSPISVRRMIITHQDLDEEKMKAWDWTGGRSKTQNYAADRDWNTSWSLNSIWFVSYYKHSDREYVSFRYIHVVQLLLLRNPFLERWSEGSWLSTPWEIFDPNQRIETMAVMFGWVTECVFYGCDHWKDGQGPLSKQLRRIQAGPAVVEKELIYREGYPLVIKPLS